MIMLWNENHWGGRKEMAPNGKWFKGNWCHSVIRFVSVIVIYLMLLSNFEIYS